MSFNYEPRETLLARSEAAAWAGADHVRSTLYALDYHIAAPSGWINDPNGLCKSGGRYHAFYQHYPYAPEWGPMHWGHASSGDLAHWRHEPIALAPDQLYEKGCFSGSAVDDGGVLTLIYTAHDDDNPIKETQCVARSFDGGKTFVRSPLNPVIPAYPAECSSDFRDPKVWKQDGKWQLVAGSSHGGRGCAVLYTGDDLDHWTYRGIMMESDGTQGSMWECPSFCTVDGQNVLIVSPMEMPGHKNIAMLGSFDCASGRMIQTHWQEVDYGEDFYAAQVLYDEGRTLMMAWMEMWGHPYETAKDGWVGALTLPRELKVRNGRLLQIPAKELETLRESPVLDTDDAELVSKLSGRSMELSVTLKPGAAPADFVLSDADGEWVKVSFCETNAVFSSRDGKTVEVPLTLPTAGAELRVFVDKCSVECFAGGGEAVYTRRIYPKDGQLSYRLCGDAERITAWPLHPAFEVGAC